MKQILRLSTNWRAPERDDAAFWAHFPELKALVRDSAQGRYASVLRKLCENAGFMNQWHVKMRYGPRKDIPDGLVEKWRAHAAEAIAAMEGC